MADLSALAVAEALARADRPEAAHVFTRREDASARAEAAEADRALAAGDKRLLLGWPVTIKDNIAQAGLPFPAGSRLLAEELVAERDAAVVTRLHEAGCVILGRTAMTEFAFSGLGLNPHFGTPANPAIPGGRHIPGGSSAGAAVAVALGIGRVGIGTDTGGSVRIPAAFCGLVGFKPTAAAISQEGVLPLSTTLDAVGMIAKSVADCAAVFDAIRDRPGERQAPGAPIRLAVVSNYVTDGIEPEVASACGDALARLGRAGVQVEQIALPALDRIPEMMRSASFAAAEAWAWHRHYIEAGRGGEYDPRVLVRIKAGAGMNEAALAQLRADRAAMIAEIGAATAGFDALVWPTTPCTAPTFASLADDAAYAAANARVLRNSTIANLLDGCAISLPCNSEGAPVGLTLAMPGGADDRLLALAEILSPHIAGATS